jgi:hypothetical protein
LSTTRSVPRVIAETPENGLTIGENVEMDDFWQKQASLRKCSTTCTLPRVTVETPKNGLTMGENVETGDFGQKRASVGKLVHDTFGTTYHSRNP